MKNNDSNNIGSFVKGKLFDAEVLFQNYKMLSFVVGLAVISIISSHWVDRQIYHISVLQKEVRELKSEFVSVRTRLMNSRMGSSLQEKVKGIGLESSTTPPFLIKVEKK